MIREVMQHADLTVWPVVGLVFFVAAFVAAALWLWVAERHTDWQAVGEMPLESGEIVDGKESRA